MFQRLPDAIMGEDVVEFSFDGRSVRARRGETVAAALIACGLVPLRTTPVSGAPRAPYCMMGACFDCLVIVDEVPDRQACMTLAETGMEVKSQSGRAVHA